MLVLLVMSATGGLTKLAKGLRSYQVKVSRHWPLDEHAPRMHWMAERSRLKDK